MRTTTKPKQKRIPDIVGAASQANSRHALIEANAQHDKYTALMHCPMCKYPYVHHENRADIINGGDYYKAAPNMCRGDVIAVPMYCESGHKFLLCFGEHKGCVHVWCSEYKGLLAPPDDPSSAVSG